MHWMIKCMLAWLRNVNIAILVSHVSWNVLTSSTLLAQPCICTIVLNGHAPISNLHCQFLCCCALLQVKISLKTHHSNDRGALTPDHYQLLRPAIPDNPTNPFCCVGNAYVCLYVRAGAQGLHTRACDIKNLFHSPL